MLLIAGVLIYLAIAKQFEPLLLLPIAFGMFLVNLFPSIMAAPENGSNGGLSTISIRASSWAFTRR